MGSQAQVSCQFFRNVFYLCLKHIKSWLVHHFREYHLWSPMCTHSTIHSSVNLTMCPYYYQSSHKSPRREEVWILSKISLSSILLSKWVYGTGDRGRDRDQKLRFPDPLLSSLSLPQSPGLFSPCHIHLAKPHIFSSNEVSACSLLAPWELKGTEEKHSHTNRSLWNCDHDL